MARKSSFSDLAYALFRAGLTAYLIDAQSRPRHSATGQQMPWSMAPVAPAEVEIELFPEESARVQQFRTQMQAAAGSGGNPSRPDIKISKEFRERARRDYEDARGTLHRRMLLDAEPYLQTEARAAQKRKIALKDETHRLESEREAELHRAVVRPIVERELATLPGIGPRRAEAIIEQVFTGHLDSLRLAFRVEGIGLQKQAAINAWIEDQARRLPELINGAFPEKAGIVAYYGQALREKKAELDRAQALESSRREALQKVYEELGWLMDVRLYDFEMAYAEGIVSGEKVARYLLGVFPPWEPMPDWFGRALEPVVSLALPTTGL